MASNRSNGSKKQRRMLALIAIVVVVIMLTGLELGHVTNFIHRSSTTADTGPTREQQEQAAAIDADHKKDAIENPTKAQPSTTPTSSTISLSAHQESNGTVTVFTKLGSIASGSCTLTVVNGSADTTQTATVLYEPEYSTCAGFSIPISGVGVGNWRLKLDVTSSGATASKTIQAEVK